MAHFVKYDGFNGLIISNGPVWTLRLTWYSVSLLKSPWFLQCEFVWKIHFSAYIWSLDYIYKIDYISIGKRKGKICVFVATKIMFRKRKNEKSEIWNQCKMAADMLAMLLVPWRVFADLEKSQLAFWPGNFWSDSTRGIETQRIRKEYTRNMKNNNKKKFMWDKDPNPSPEI